MVQHTGRISHQQGMQISQSSIRCGSSSQRSGDNSRLPIRSGSRGGRRRQSFETTIQDTISGYTEFQRQSLQQLRPSGSIDENKLQLLEAMTGVSRNNKDVPKQLGAEQSFGSLYAQQWGTPPTAQQWGTPPFAQQRSTPANSQQWGTPPNVSRWGTP
ncbi:unnamed protein product, partial [Brassica napus]